MAVSRQNRAWASSSNPMPFARLATAVAPRSDARLRCEELAFRLTNSRQAMPPAIAATKKDATENHVGSIMRKTSLIKTKRTIVIYGLNKEMVLKTFITSPPHPTLSSWGRRRGWSSDPTPLER